MSGKEIKASSAESPVARFFSRFPFIAVIAVSLIALIATGNQIKDPHVTFVIIITGCTAILAAGIYMRAKGRLTDEVLIQLLFAAGFWIKLCYVLYTDIMTRQCDVEAFIENNYHHSHADYILYIRDFLRLPDYDVTQHGQFYHPPFHHFVCAMFLKVYELFLPKGTHNYESLQTLTLICSQGAAYYMFKILRQLGIKDKGLVNGALIIAAFPSMTIFAGSINNDILALMLFFAAFYYGIKWYREGKTKDILISALCTGFGMMTKLSVGLIAFPMGFIFIVRFIKDIREKKGLKSFGQLACFAVIAAPLGTWYSIWNYVRYQTPIGYVLKLEDLTYMEVSDHSPFERLFGFYGFPIEDFYINLGAYGEKDYNIFIAQVKTMLFGYANCRDNMILSLTGYVLLLIALVLILASFTGLIYTAVTVKKHGRPFEDFALIILFVAEIVSIIYFSFNFPHVCSQDFRYDFPALLAGVFFIANMSGSKPAQRIPGKCLNIFCAGFFVMSVVYYSILWIYVTG